MEWHILKAFFSQVSVLHFSKTSKNPEDVILEKKKKKTGAQNAGSLQD